MKLLSFGKEYPQRGKAGKGKGKRDDDDGDVDVDPLRQRRDDDTIPAAESSPKKSGKCKRKPLDDGN